VFIRIINHLRKNTYFETGKFLPWATTIAHNIVIDYKRKAKTKPMVVPFESDTFQSYFKPDLEQESKCIKTERDNYLTECLNKLPKAQREVLVLKIYGDLTFKNIGEVTNSNINTAIGRMQYGMKNLRKLLEQTEIAA